MSYGSHTYGCPRAASNEEAWRLCIVFAQEMLDVESSASNKSAASFWHRAEHLVSTLQGMEIVEAAFLEAHEDVVVTMVEGDRPTFFALEKVPFCGAVLVTSSLDGMSCVVRGGAGEHFAAICPKVGKLYCFTGQYTQPSALMGTYLYASVSLKPASAAAARKDVVSTFDEVYFIRSHFGGSQELLRLEHDRSYELLQVLLCTTSNPQAATLRTATSGQYLVPAGAGSELHLSQEPPSSPSRLLVMYPSTSVPSAVFFVVHESPRAPRFLCLGSGGKGTTPFELKEAAEERECLFVLERGDGSYAAATAAAVAVEAPSAVQSGQRPAPPPPRDLEQETVEAVKKLEVSYETLAVAVAWLQLQQRQGQQPTPEQCRIFAQFLKEKIAARKAMLEQARRALL